MSEAGNTTDLWRLPPPVLVPERADRQHHWLDRLESAAMGFPVLFLHGLHRARLSRIVAMVNDHGPALATLDPEGLQAEGLELRRLLRRRGFRDDVVARAFALVREVAHRTISLRHFDVQLLGGFAILKGMIAEMETGEGKTLTATLAAGTAGLAGIPVHVVTVNDYLAQRDAEEMGPIYRALGLNVGLIVHGLSPEERRASYACDVTYCSNKEIAFDYLRDRIAIGRSTDNLRLKLERLYGKDRRSDRVVMRGLHFAIVDEADSVLVDEARTPLIISSKTEPGDEQRWAEEAMGMANALEPKLDYRVLADERQIELTEAGKERLIELTEQMGDPWHGRIRREEAARQALAAHHLYRRDEHYLVRDDQVQIVDEYTGRVMPDRSWSEGLHQLIEVKEQCRVTGRNVPIARMSYQRLFRRYRRLAGMTGTAREVARELWSVYRLPIVTVPTNRALQRHFLPSSICPTVEDKWHAIVTRAAELHDQGRPILIGTRSVAASEAVSRQLAEHDLLHVVLSAAQNRDEAEIIARAGDRGQITVATNMAGRGVDIRLGEGVSRLGGLHVILSERHDAGRIDRQLAGRCGRQGDPGSTEAILSLEDPLLDIVPGGLLRRATAVGGRQGQIAARLLFRQSQRRAERTHSRMRRQLMKLDQRLGTLLAFSGKME
ncbi:MAG: preprotein translocase subunit SecA [Hyphomicrobium sp.]